MIYHFIREPDWKQALSGTLLTPDSLATEGFIHCSTGPQLNGTATRFYCGCPDLLVLCIDEKLLECDLRYESASDGTGLYPHLYGPLNLTAVRRTRPFRPEPDGTFNQPDV